MTFISYAQNFEDIMLWRALKHVENGFYIDVGANDPEVDSVTLAFYQRGWRGINVEPMQQYHEKLRIKRPSDINLRLAVGDTPGELTFYDVPDTGLSTADAAISELHAAAGHTVKRQQVQVTTLGAICSQYVHGPIHFLKIDVEGFEKAALRGMDFKRWRPWILVIEATKPQTQATNHHEWESLVVDAGYRFAYFDGLNRYYAAQEHQELLAAFNAPPNFFDHFQLREDHAFSHSLGTLKEKIREAEAVADRMRAQAQEADARVREADTHLQDAEARVRDALFQVQQTAAQLEQVKQQVQQAQAETFAARHDLAAVYASASWRVTRPLRQAKTAIRNPGVIMTRLRLLAGRTKAFGRKTLVRIARRLAAQPGVRLFAGRVLSRFPGIREKVKGVAARLSAPPVLVASAPVDLTRASQELPESGRKTFSSLQRSINKSQ